jgi:hypothetical protein
MTCIPCSRIHRKFLISITHSDSFTSRVDQRRRLHTMFHQPYQGNAVDEFTDALEVYNEIYDPRQHFGRCIPIVQSNCTGKSRLVQELGNKVRSCLLLC